jgi:hypothetical protein
MPVNVSFAHFEVGVTGDVADLSLAGAQQQPEQQEGYMLDHLSSTVSFAGAAGGVDARIAPLIPALQVVFACTLLSAALLPHRPLLTSCIAAVNSKQLTRSSCSTGCAGAANSAGQCPGVHPTAGIGPPG